jgi:hypothetical protein
VISGVVCMVGPFLNCIASRTPPVQASAGGTASVKNALQMAKTRNSTDG